MSTNVEQGDKAVIIGGTDNLNCGKIVKVGQYVGDHSKLGVIWHIRSLGLPLVTEYGAVGMECDCADRWLKKLPPETNLLAEVEELFRPAPITADAENDNRFAKAA